MAANRRKQDDKNLEILRELISLNGNKYCLDCNQRGPTYVNTTIGSFVCSKCSGMLRGLTPPHRVKSISMATFTPEEIEFIKSRGNDYCRRVWLGLYEGESVNFTDEQSIKDFMCDKYEKKRYYLESSATNPVLSNGASLQKSKSKSKSGSNSSVTTALISISPQSSNIVNKNTVVNTNRVMNNFSNTLNDNSLKLARPVINNVQPLINNNVSLAQNQPLVFNTTPVPDFPVDFSTANIYNSSQYNNNLQSNLMPPTNNTPALSAFNSSSTNDRYAALADLDLALRQQNMKNMEDNNTSINSNNPFQSTSSHDLFINKNPFVISGLNTMSAPVPVNPFMQSSNNGSLRNSNNPFL